MVLAHLIHRDPVLVVLVSGHLSYEDRDLDLFQGVEAAVAFRREVLNGSYY